MSTYTQGVCSDGAAILRDGAPMTIEEILAGLRQAQEWRNRAQDKTRLWRQAMDERDAAQAEVRELRDRAARLERELSRACQQHEAAAKALWELRDTLGRAPDKVQVAIWAHGYDQGHSDGIGCGHPLARRCLHFGTQEAADYADEIAEIAAAPQPEATP